MTRRKSENAKDGDETRGRRTAEVWARRTPEERSAIGAKISQSWRLGFRPQSELSRLRKSVGLLRHYSELTDEQKVDRVAAARQAALAPEVKARRSTSFGKWVDANPGARGGKGLTPEQTEALNAFLALHPLASDAECAQAVGRSRHLVAKYRSARQPWKTTLLRDLLQREDFSAMVELARRADQRLAGEEIAFLSSIKSGDSLQAAIRQSGIASNRGDRLAEKMLLLHGYSRDDWRRSNRFRSSWVANCCQPSDGDQGAGDEVDDGTTLLVLRLDQAGVDPGAIARVVSLEEEVVRWIMARHDTEQRAAIIAAFEKGQ